MNKTTKDWKRSKLGDGGGKTKDRILLLGDRTLMLSEEQTADESNEWRVEMISWFKIVND